MSLLREYVRELLTEAAKAPQDLPDGIWVKIKEDDWGVEVAYINKLGNELGPRQRINGIVMVENIPEDDDSLGSCGGAWMIGSSQAAPGWGPMLYDVAMEYATMKGGGIMADRGSVSPTARNVWDYYMNNRGDVTGIQMDDRKNTLTPEEEDNCSQKVAGFDNRSQQDKSKLSPTGTYKTDWVDSPLSKRWTKPPTTIEALRAAGKLVWHEAGDYLPIRDLDEEGPIIHLEQYIKGLLFETVEFREVDSPLEYARSSNVKRIALCDTSVTEPAGKHDSYFTEIEKWRKYTKGGRKLKKPVLDEIIPGVSDVCIIGFLDYHKEAKLEDGTTFWYIDYMKNRSDMRGQGSASQLIEKFYDTIPQPGDYVNFGQMMQPAVGHLKDKMAEKYPEIKTKGAKYF
jgi:hypothetical protein